MPGCGVGVRDVISLCVGVDGIGEINCVFRVGYVYGSGTLNLTWRHGHFLDSTCDMGP